MRRHNVIIIAIICEFFLLAGCQQEIKVPEEAESKKAGPKIEFESMVYDFGKVGPSQKLVGEFKFTNTGDAPLKITKVEKCCGAVTQLDKEELQTGETGILKVRYTSSSMPNKIKKLLYVNTNDKENPRVTLTIRAETVLKVDWEPKSLRLMLNEENAGCPEITLWSTENQSFSITKFESTGDFINAKIDNSVTAAKFVLQPQVNMEKLQKSQTGRIRIGVAYSEPNIPPESISILFRALARFSTMPLFVKVSYSEPKKPISKHLWIIGNYGEDFGIESTSSKEGYVKVINQKKNRNGNSYLLSLEITPPEAKSLSFNDVLYVNLKSEKAEETLEVNCQGIYSKPTEASKLAQGTLSEVSDKAGKTELAATEPNGPTPKIEFESKVYDFGNVRPRIKNIGEFKFTNTGDAPLKITKVERCCGIVTTLEKNDYAPGESGILKVKYTSGRLPNKIVKKLYVNSNDKENPRVMLTIQAETILKVKYEPRHIKLMLMKENAGCPPITIKSVDNKSFSITDFQATGECLTADIDSTVEATQFVIKPKADVEKLEKSQNGRININLAFSDPDEATDTITIYFNALKRFSASPAMLLLLYHKPGEPIKKTLFITDNNDEQFEVESTSVKEGYIKVLDQRKVGNRCQFKLEITPPPGEDVKRFSDNFTIRLKGGETLEVPCRGIYRAPKSQNEQ